MKIIRLIVYGLCRGKHAVLAAEYGKRSISGTQQAMKLTVLPNIAMIAMQR
jgi:hypothetical protein